MKDKFAFAVKAVIANGDKVLLLKRSGDDSHFPSIWELPGGRLDRLDEHPQEGLKREVMEETGIEIEVLNPLKVIQFKHHDGVKITMIIFLCKALTEIKELSHEHTHAEWVEVKKAISQVHPLIREEIELYQKYFHGKIQ